jgi:hypothetical protein
LELSKRDLHIYLRFIVDLLQNNKFLRFPMLEYLAFLEVWVVVVGFERKFAQKFGYMPALHVVLHIWLKEWVGHASLRYLF